MTHGPLFEKVPTMADRERPKRVSIEPKKISRTLLACITTFAAGGAGWLAFLGFLQMTGDAMIALMLTFLIFLQLAPWALKRQ